MVTKSLDSFMKLVGGNYLHSVLAPLLSEISHKKTKSMEIDPTKMDKKQNAKKNKQQLRATAISILERIFDSVDDCPPFVFFFVNFYC